MVKVLKKKYRINEGFTYKGRDGKSTKPVNLGPGEEVPDLDDENLQRLLERNSIVEVDEKTGENIYYKAKKHPYIAEDVALDINECRHLVQQLRKEHKTACEFLQKNRLMKDSLVMLKEAFDEFLVQPYLNSGGEISDLDKDPDEVDLRRVNLGLNRYILLFKNEMDSQLLTVKE